MTEKIVPKSLNRSGGYWKAIGNDPERDSPQADERWRMAALAIVAFTGFTQEEVVKFLDSTYGAHFGDEVVSYKRLGSPADPVELPLRRAIWKWSDARNPDLRLGALIRRANNLHAGVPL